MLWSLSVSDWNFLSASLNMANVGIRRHVRNVLPATPS